MTKRQQVKMLREWWPGTGSKKLNAAFAEAVNALAREAEAELTMKPLEKCEPDVFKMFVTEPEPRS